MSGGYNFAAVLIGDAGSGKTTLAQVLVRDFLEEWRSGIVLAHDPAGQFSGGDAFEEAADAREAIRAAQRGRRAMHRVISCGGEAREVTRLALELGEVNRADRVVRPVLVVYDEASMLSSGRTHIDKLEEQALAVRRHRGVGSITCAQQATQLAAPYLYFATECRLFRSATSTVRRVEDLFGLEPGDLEAARSLRPFRHLRIVRGARR